MDGQPMARKPTTGREAPSCQFSPLAAGSFVSNARENYLPVSRLLIAFHLDVMVFEPASHRMRSGETIGERRIELQLPTA